MTERYETGGNCTARPPPPSTAIGCYQMTRLALVDVGLKDHAGNWLVNPWGITSDQEFQRNRAANDYAVKQFTRLNWGYLNCDTKRAACRTGHPVELDPASLLSGAHFLGAGDMNRFVACGMRAECLRDVVVRRNGGNRARIYRGLLRRMEDVRGLDISELTPPDRRNCGPQGTCGATSPPPSPPPSGASGAPPPVAPPRDPVTPPPPPPPPPVEREEPGVPYGVLAFGLAGTAALGVGAFLASRRMRGSPRREPANDGWPHGDWSPPDGGAHVAAGPAPAPDAVAGFLHPADASPPIPLPRELLSAHQGLVIGRDVELSDVQIPDPEISGRHLRLRAVGGRFVVEDLNSLAGTHADGVALAPFDPRPIASGQTLNIAGRPYRLRLEDGEHRHRR